LTSQVASIALKLTEEFFGINDKIVLFYSGMSGIASATALTTLSACVTEGPNPAISALVYVRKPLEDSHGQVVEISIINEFKSTDRIIPVFIDDFVCEGRTFKYVKKQIAKYVRKGGGLFLTEHDNCKKFFDKLSRKKNWWIAEVDRDILKRAPEIIKYA
jgi:hypothetical protein